MQLNDIRFLITHANEGKQIYDMLTNLLLHSFVKTANNCCKSFLLTTAWTPYFLGEKRHKRMAWWHFLCCDLQSKLQPRQVAYSNKIANDSGEKNRKHLSRRSCMYSLLPIVSFSIDWPSVQSICLVRNPNCKCCWTKSILVFRGRIQIKSFFTIFHKNWFFCKKIGRKLGESKPKTPTW